jgi:hypothetical protein
MSESMAPDGLPQMSAFLAQLGHEGAPSAALLHSAPTAADPGPVVPSSTFEVKNHPESFMTVTPVRSGQLDALRERLRGKVFTTHSPGVHNARFTILADGHLLFTVIYDTTRTCALQFLQANAATVDEVWRFCEGYPEAGASDLNALDAFLQKWDKPVLLMFSAYIDPGEPVVREAVALRQNFLRLARTVQHDPGGILVHYDAFLDDNRRRVHAAAERHEADLAADGMMIPGSLTTAFTMVSQVLPGIEPMAKLRFTLGFGNFIVNTFRINPISEMTTVHYARFAMYDTNKLIFASIYDGDWLQYVQDFSVRIPFQMDKVWGNCVGWPAKGAADTDALLAYLESCTAPTNVFYSAYMDVTSKDILASYALGKALWNFTSVPPTDAQSFHARYIAFLSANQALLP